MEPQNRRSLLRNACGLGIAASLGAIASPLAGCGSGSADAATPPLDYLYTPLDVEAARKRGHFEYESGLECCEGAFKAIVGPLDEQVGAPFTGFPTNYQGPYYILLAKQFASRKKGDYKALQLNKNEIKSLLLQYLQVTSEIKSSLERIGKKDSYYFVEADLHKLRRNSLRVV